MADGSETPVGFASRTLSSAECSYSRLEKEGLACVLGVKKFHTYLYGRTFTLVTDHKPLLGLFKQERAIPAQTSVRIQRWALTLAKYKYNLQFRKSSAHGNADALSRLPLPEGPEVVPDPPEVVLLMEHLDSSPVRASDVRRETSRNSLLSHVLQWVLQGWPVSCNSEEFKPYWSRKFELSILQGYLLWGN